MKEYEIQINGITHTVLLSDEEAEKRGLTAKKADPPANKGRSSTPNKSAQ